MSDAKMLSVVDPTLLQLWWFILLWNIHVREILSWFQISNVVPQPTPSLVV